MISIILPIYNGERFLSVALESVKNQTYGDFECLCIDDGSMDSSAEIVRHFAENDRRFRLIQQANSGVATARNRGLTEAKGEYVTFLDQDDALLPLALETMLKTIRKTGCNVVAAGIKEFNEAKLPSCEENTSNKNDHIHISRTPLYDFFGIGKESCVTVAVWGKLYAYEAIKTIRFPDGIFGADDYVFSARLFHSIDSYAIIDRQLYLYRMHTENVTSQMPMRYIEGTLSARELIYDEITRWHDIDDNALTTIRKKMGKETISWAIKKTCRNQYTLDEMRQLRLHFAQLLNKGMFSALSAKDRLKCRLFCWNRRYLLRLFFPSLFRVKRATK